MDNESEEIKNNISCSICIKEDFSNDDIYTTNCGHEFCKSCLDDWFQRGNVTCPLCRGEITDYTHQNKNYKLVIRTVETEAESIQMSLNDLINRSLVVRNIVKQNFKLKCYCYSLMTLFLYTLNLYFYNLQDINILSKDLEICSLNNTKLRGELDNCELFSDTDLGNGYYVGMFNGELTRRCFYPSKFYNICFNK